MFKTEPAVPHVKPSTIWQYLTEAEEKVWGQGMVDADNSLSSDSETGDIGGHILRHGTTGRKIHDYFSNLEARKCCLKLRLEARKTTFSNIRLVRQDGRDLGIEEGAMMKTPLDHRVKVSHLDSSTLRVFKRAYMCAVFPVLGAPDPPSAFSPSPVHNTVTQRVSYSGILSISRPTTPFNVSDSGLEDAEEDTTSLIPAETLCELLKRVFRLSDQKFTHYEQSISETFGKNTQQKVLAEELVNQLAALENNSNPFYNPHSFKSRPEYIRKGYDYWQQQEREHLTELINKFWHFSLPSPGVNFSMELTGVHEDYRKLLAKLIQYESPYKSEHEEFGPTPASSLSSASARLLKEFGLRYGVGEQFRKFVYLQYLAQHFDATVWFIQHVSVTLANIMEWLPSNRNHLTITQEEFGILESSLHLLLGQAGNAISKMKRLFPHNRPPDGVASLIELLGRSLSLKSYLSMKTTKPLQDCLRKYTQVLLWSLLSVFFLEWHIEAGCSEAFVTAYERHKLLAMAELQQSSATVLMCPKLLNILIVNIRDDVNDYRTNYQSTFERYFNISESAAQAFYSYLMSDVLTLCQAMAKNVSSPEIDLLMLSLAYRLNSLDHDWARYIPPESQRWREPFVTLTVQWTMALHSYVPLLLLEAVGGDQFKSLPLPGNIRSPTSSNSDQRGRSTSLRSLSASVRSAFSSVSSTRSTPVGKEPQSVSQFEGPGRFVIKQPPIMETSYEAVLPGQSQGNADVELDTGQLANGQPRMRSPRRSSSHSVDVLMLRHQNAEDIIEDTSDEVMSFTRQNIRTSNSLPDLLPGRSFSYFPPFTENVHQSLGSFRCIPGDSTSKLDGSTVPKVWEHGHVIPSVELTPSTPLVNGGSNPNSDSCDREKAASAYPPLVVVNNKSGGSQFNNVTDKNIPHIEAEVGGNSDVIAHTLRPATPLLKGLIRVPSAPSMSQMASAFTAHPHAPKPLHMDDPDANSSPPEKQKNSSESHEFLDSFRSDFTSVSMTAHHCPEFQIIFAPISASLVDLLIILQRITGVARTFCETICPVTNETGLHRHGYWDNVSFGSDDLENVSYCRDNAGARCQLFLLFSRTICQSLCIFTDNMLCMDLCGVPLSLAKRLVGPKLVEYVQAQKHGGLVWGCRHDIPGAANSCYHFLHRKTFLLCDRYEPISEEMCTRINNVAAVLDYLKKYYEIICTIFGIHDDNDVTNFLSDSNTEETGYESGFLDDLSSEYVVIDSYNYEMESECLPPMEPSSLFSSPRTTPVPGVKVPIFPVLHCWRHIMSVLRGMCRILAYRLNLFLRDALALLLSPDMASVSVADCLTPIQEFLLDNLSALADWLYRDAFRRILLYIWLYIVQDFEEEVSKLKTGEFNSERHAELLTHAMSYLLRFMNNMGRGVHVDQLLSYSEDVSFKLQLYSLTTPLLSLLYENLVHYYSESAENGSNQTDIPHGILRRMKIELQSRRKCFSGRQLVGWLLRNQDKGLITSPFLEREDSYTGRTTVSRENAHRLAQKLLDKAAIVDVEHDGSRTHASSLSDETPYPNISIHNDFEEPSPETETNPSAQNSESVSRKSESSSTTTIQDSDTDSQSFNVSDAPVKAEMSGNDMNVNSLLHGVGNIPGGEPIRGDNCDDKSKDKEGDNDCDNNDSDIRRDLGQVTADETSLKSSCQLRNNDVRNGAECKTSALCCNKNGNLEQEDVKTELKRANDNGEDVNPKICEQTERNEVPVTDNSASRNGNNDGRVNTEAGKIRQDQPITATNRSAQSSLSQDTSSYLTSNSSSVTFQDSPHKFYMFSPEGAEMKHLGTSPTSQSTEGYSLSRVRRELLGLLETCFHKKITPNYILLILYARRKYDQTAKNFFKQIPEDTLTRLCCQVDAPCTACAGS